MMKKSVSGDFKKIPQKTLNSTSMLERSTSPSLTTVKDKQKKKKATIRGGTGETKSMGASRTAVKRRNFSHSLSRHPVNVYMYKVGESSFLPLTLIPCDKKHNSTTTRWSKEEEESRQ